MTNDKYYTPTIEEFHVGFEYEAFLQQVEVLEELHQEGDNWVYPVESIRYNWVPQIYEQDDFLEHDAVNEEVSFRDIYSSEIRVKYLDKADIEELGFKYMGIRDYHKRNGIEESGWTKLLEDGSYCDIKCFLDSNNKVDSQLDISSTDIFCSDTHTPWDAYCEGGRGPGCWQIRIKNKSELKRLLDQLGIT